jgi:hypothetical protein
LCVCAPFDPNPFFPHLILAPCMCAEISCDSLVAFAFPPLVGERTVRRTASCEVLSNATPCTNIAGVQLGNLEWRLCRSSVMFLPSESCLWMSRFPLGAGGNYDVHVCPFFYFARRHCDTSVSDFGRNVCPQTLCKADLFILLRSFAYKIKFHMFTSHDVSGHGILSPLPAFIGGWFDDASEASPVGPWVPARASQSLELAETWAGLKAGLRSPFLAIPHAFWRVVCTWGGKLGLRMLPYKLLHRLLRFLMCIFYVLLQPMQ